MKVVLDNGTAFDLGEVEATPTIGITDYSRRQTDDFGITTVVERGFSRTLSVRLALPISDVDGLQRRLADLRATAARWSADADSSWLQPRGYYKDFTIDVAMEPVSFCTLTVEGLAETEVAADDGADPAPVGQASTFQLLQPIRVTEAVLVASDVPETDAQEWSSTTTYPLDAVIMKAATHRLYQSLKAGNLGNDPATTPGAWVDAGPTNRWAMFDEALGSVTSSSRSVSATLKVAGANGAALLDLVGDSVRVQAQGYDRTVAIETGSVILTDLPEVDGQIVITVTGPAQVSVGTMLVGRVVGLGMTEASPTAAITDYSRKVTDDFGEVTVVERAWAKRMTAKALIDTAAIDAVANRIAAVRARPSLWMAQDGLDSLTVYGFFKDFSIERDETVSTVSLSIEGLSKAAKPGSLVADVTWPNVGDPDGTKPADNATNTADPDAPFGPGRTVFSVTKNIDDLIDQARDLVAMYGDTESAEQSANAAAAAAQAAGAAAANADARATSADQSAVSATGSASVASSKADEAGQSAQAARASVVESQGFSDQAETAAQASQTSSTSAGASAAAAASSAQLSASVASAALNTNPVFANWPDGQAAPYGWGAGGATKVAGTVSPFAVSMGSSQELSVSTVPRLPRVIGGAYFVIEADLRPKGDSRDSIAIGLQGYADDISGGPVWGTGWSLGAIPDETGIAQPSFNGDVKRFRILANARYPASRQFRLYIDTGPTATCIVDKLALRLASQAEIDGNQALPAAQALINAEASVRASNDSAVSQRLDTMDARVGSAEGSLSDLRTVVANNYASAAQQISTLGAFASTRTNLAPGLSTWATGYAGIPFQRNPGWGECFLGTIGQTGEFTIAASPRIGIDGGSTLTLSYDGAAYGSPGCYVYMDWIAYDAAGNILQDADSNGRVENINFSDDRNRSTWAYTGRLPDNAASILIRAIGANPNGGTAVLGFRKVKLERGAGATAYTAEGSAMSLDAKVTVQSQVVSDLLGRINTASFTVDVAAGAARGVISVRADGISNRSSIDLIAGGLGIWSQDGTVAHKIFGVDEHGATLDGDFRMKNGRIVKDNGAYMKVEGLGFGTNAQFLEWFGPTMDISQCSEANAVSYTKMNGETYFGGTISAGVIRNAGQSTDTSLTAATQVGPLSTNGRTKKVAVSYLWRQTYRCDPGTGSMSGSGAAQIVIERGSSGGDWAQIGVLNAQGNGDVQVDGDPTVQDIVTYTISGSTTVDDNSPVSDTLMFRARLVSRTSAALGGQHITSNKLTQNITLVETEN